MGLVLVFGLPRTGTTWIGKLIDSHPDTLYRHEPDSVLRLRMPLFPDLRESKLYTSELRNFVAELPELRVPKIVAKRPIFPKRYLSSPSLLAYRMGTVIARTSGRKGQNRPVTFSPTAAGFRERRVVWKSIESLGRLGVCLSALPEARAIFILRHPCGYVASVQRGEAARQFTSSTASSEDYGILEQLLDTEPARTRKLTLTDFRHMAPEERLAWRWLLVCEKARLDTVNCDQVMLIRYEELCGDPTGITARMFEFVGLEMNAQTSAFIEATTSRSKGGYYSLYHNPVAAASRWQDELSPEVIDRVLGVLQQSRLAQFYLPTRLEVKQA